MMRSRLRDRDRRALLAGAVVLVPALLLAFVVKPFTLGLLEARDRLAIERGLLRRELALLADAQVLPEVVAGREAALRREAPRLFAGSDPLAATAALERYVAEQAMASRVFVQQSEALHVGEVGSGLTAIRARIRAVSDLDGLLRLLDTLDTGSKLVHVERLVLGRVEQRFRGEERDEITLDISLTVVGYALADPVSDGASGVPLAAGFRGSRPVPSVGGGT